MSIEQFSQYITTAATGDRGLAPDEIVVATEVVTGPGEPARCPAATILRGALRRRGFDARLGVLTAHPPGKAGSSPLLMVASFQKERTIAIGVPAGDPDALSAARAVLCQAVAARRPRRVVLASPRSFCAGVERAIEIVERILDRHGPPVYVRKQIVHNAYVVRQLEERGVVFVEELDAVPSGAPVVFSAHGVSPAVRAEAEDRGLDAVDATCPLVTKVHAEARRFAQRGHTIIFIGHEGHEETEGTLGEAPENTILVRDAADVATLEVPDPGRMVYLTQTTLALDETEEVIKALRTRFPAIRGPRSEDICYATTNRQNALRAVLDQADVVLVVGSENSSNSLRLVELADRGGTPAHLVDDAAEIELEWLAGAGTIGLTAGASAPPALVDEVVAALDGLGPVEIEENPVTHEDIQFALPRKVARS